MFFASEKKAPCWAWQCLALVFTGIILLIFPRVFLENDDLGFIYLLSHGFYAPWVSKPFCWLLIHLYAALPDVAWYGILQYLILALLLGLLLKLTDDWAVDQQRSPIVRRWLTGAILLLFYPFILRITFTCVSILSGGIGILLLLASFRQGQPSGPKSRYLWSVFGFGSVFALCYFVRPEGIGAMIFLLPAMLYAAYGARQWILSRQGALIGLVFLIPFLGSLILDNHLMRYPTNQVPYLTYVVSSNNVFGFGSTEQFKNHPEWLRPLGWSRNDYTMLERFLYWDESVFSQDKINQLAHRTPEAAVGRLKNLLNPGILFARLYKTLIKTWLSNYTFTLYCVGLLILFSWMGTSRLSRVFPPLFLGFVFTGSMLMQYVMRFPYRVACPTIILVTLSLLAMPGFEVNRLYNAPGKLKRASALLLTFCALWLFIFNGPVRIVRTALLPLSQTRTKLDALNRLMVDHYLLREAAVIPISASDPLNPTPLKAPDIGPGWLIQSPPYYQRLHAFGLPNGAALIPASVNNSKILYFFKDKDLPSLETFIAQHYRQTVRFTPVEHLLPATVSHKSHLYQLRSQ